MTNIELAERLDRSATPIARRRRRLEDEGYIRGYAAVVEHQKVGYSVTAYVSVRLRSNEWRTAESFEREVRTLANVMECCVVTGSSDYLLRVVARDLRDYERFLKQELAVIPAVNTIDSTIVLNQVLDRNCLPL
jgi:DNA-binding Lrp family transcriptional regulator